MLLQFPLRRAFKKHVKTRLKRIGVLYVLKKAFKHLLNIILKSLLKRIGTLHVPIRSFLLKKAFKKPAENDRNPIPSYSFHLKKALKKHSNNRFLRRGTPYYPMASF